MARGLTAEVKAEARRLGFELVGVTVPDPPEHVPVFSAWLEAGRHGEMTYLDSERSRQRRADPRQILPECRSILVLGMRYANPDQKDLPAGSGLGRVAAYSWGDDYHDVLPERLKALAAFVEKQAGHPVPNRCYTDTGPILERDLAQRAGLGWIGKNTCLIHPQKGSYFLLAEILLGIDLEPDPPFETDHCGSCTRCIEACPTSCILPDRTIDARRCISYLTIELKGPVPAQHRSRIGNLVFGCDICQQVCPWNLRFAAEGEGAVEPAFAHRPGIPNPRLVDELQLTPEAFKVKFKGSPVKRAKRRGYLRNVAVALGNSREPAALPALIQAMQNDPELLVRGHAAWAVGQIGGEQARLALQKASEIETDLVVLSEIQTALEQQDIQRVRQPEGP